MDFDTFAKLYELARIRMNRADDLFVAQIADSEASETIEGNDEKRYTIGTRKLNGIASVHAEPSFRIEADIAAKTVISVTDENDVAFLLDVLESENLNGLETMRFFDSNHRHDTPLDEFEDSRSTAEKAARMIISGIGSYPELDPSETTLVAQEIIAALTDPNQFAYATRLQRVFAWSLDPRTQPEWGFYVAAWIVRNVDRTIWADEAPIDGLRATYPALSL